MTRGTLYRTLALAALVVAALVSGGVAFGQQQGFRLIAHSTVSESSLSKEQASDYFLKKDTKWESGVEVKPVDLNVREVREAFSSEVHDRSLGAVKKFWQRQIFTGRGTPPPEKASDREVIDFVEKTPGAIGYVSPGTDLSKALVKQLQLR